MYLACTIMLNKMTCLTKLETSPASKYQSFRQVKTMEKIIDKYIRKKSMQYFLWRNFKRQVCWNEFVRSWKMHIFIRSRKHPPLQIQTYIGPLSSILSRKFHYASGHNKPQSAKNRRFKLIIQSKNRAQFSLKTNLNC